MWLWVSWWHEDALFFMPLITAKKTALFFSFFLVWSLFAADATAWKQQRRGPHKENDARCIQPRLFCIGVTRPTIGLEKEATARDCFSVDEKGTLPGANLPPSTDEWKGRLLGGSLGSDTAFLLSGRLHTHRHTSYTTHIDILPYRGCIVCCVILRMS